jgi:hypothetical protein
MFGSGTLTWIQGIHLLLPHGNLNHVRVEGTYRYDELHICPCFIIFDLFQIVCSE